MALQALTAFFSLTKINIFRKGGEIASAWEVGKFAYDYIVSPVIHWITNMEVDDQIIGADKPNLNTKSYAHYRPIPIELGNRESVRKAQEQGLILLGKNSGAVTEAVSKTFDVMISRFCSGVHNWHIEIEILIKSLILARIIIRREVVLTPEAIELLTKMAIADAQAYDYILFAADSGDAEARPTFSEDDVDENVENLSGSVFRAFELFREKYKDSYQFVHIPDAADDTSGATLMRAHTMSRVMLGDVPVDNQDFPSLMFNR